MKKVEISTKRNSLIQADFSSGKGLLANMEVTYGPNLILNGGGQGSTGDFVDSNGDGLADGFTLLNATTSISTGNGFIGNAQKLTGTETTYFYLRKLGFITTGKKYQIKLKYRSSKQLEIYLNGSNLSTLAILPANTGTATLVTYEGVASSTDIAIGSSSSLIVGDWIEIDELELREVLIKDNSGLGNDLSVYGSLTNRYLGSLPGFYYNQTSYLSSFNANLAGISGDRTFIFLVKPYSTVEYFVGKNSAQSTGCFLGQDGTTSKLAHYNNVISNSVIQQYKIIALAVRAKGATTDVFINGVLDKTNSLTLGANLNPFIIANFDSGGFTIGSFACIPKALSDTEIQSISQRLLLLANNCGVWKASDTNALGPNLVKNGSFDDPSVWTYDPPTVTISNRIASVVYSGDFNWHLFQDIGAGTGKTYKITVTISGYVTGSVFISIGGDRITSAMMANGTYIFNFTVTEAGATKSIIYIGGSTATYKIDDIKVQEVSEKYTPITDTTFVGVHTIAGNTGDLSKPNAESVALTEIYSGANIFYDATNHLLYGPLPLTTVEPIVDAKADGNKVYALSKAGLSEFSLDTYQRLSHKADAGNNIAVSAAGQKYVYVTDAKAIKLSLVSPSTGRTLTYTRKVSGANYIHTYLKDGLQIEQKTTANLFENPRLMEFPFFVSGSEFKIDPCDYVIDEIMIDNKVYDNYQIRSWAKADVLKDNNVKSLIAGVIGFSNSNIFSIDEIVNNQSAYAPELISLAKANNNPEKEIFYESE